LFYFPAAFLDGCFFLSAKQKQFSEGNFCLAERNFIPVSQAEKTGILFASEDIELTPLL